MVARSGRSDGYPSHVDPGPGGVLEADDPRESAPLVALVGPPNSGKSTLFNRLTGLRQKVANYPGVTVEKYVGAVRLDGDRTVNIVDLPGLHGLSARSLDERVTRNVLEGRVDGLRAPDALVLIVDSTRLETQLMLAEPVLELGVPTLLVLNMADELEKRGGAVNEKMLADHLGVHVARTSARIGQGLEEVRQFLMGVADRGRLPSRPCPALAVEEKGQALPMLDTFVERRRRVQEVAQLAKFTQPSTSRLTEKLDAVLLHRVWGPLVFLVLGMLVFQAIFTWATLPMDGVEALIAGSGEWLAVRMADSWLRSLLIDGVWAGVGSVVVFLPQILVLFFFLGALEDSGYMARAAVIADRLMYRVGLQGRAFLPLLSGYACAIPAILAARTVADERDRLATIFVTPFMTCSARLPVYALLIAAFIPEKPVLPPFLGTRAAALLGLYILGALAAIVTASLLRRTLLHGRPSSFLMELPPYRVPSLRSLLLRLVDRSRIFLRRAGTIIFAVTIVLWTLTQIPQSGSGPPPVDASLLGRMGQFIEPLIEPLGFDWQIGVGLISSLAAREVIVGTLGTLYSVQEPTEGSFALQEALRRDLDLGGAVALLVFFAFALQCMSTVAVMRRETAGWKWPALQFGYMLTLAYAGAYLANWLI